MKNGKNNNRTPRFSESLDILKVCSLLNQEKAKYLVVGGVALNLHGLSRNTKDIDLLIPKDVSNTQRVLKALTGLTFSLAQELDAKEVTNKPMTIIGDTPRVDLLTVANRVKYIDAQKTALSVKIEGIRIPYVDKKTLIETKQTDRLQDKADIERLRQILKNR
jgi:hypothetical protein